MLEHLIEPAGRSHQRFDRRMKADCGILEYGGTGRLPRRLQARAQRGLIDTLKEVTLRLRACTHKPIAKADWMRRPRPYWW